jgi:hypothetical protein
MNYLRAFVAEAVPATAAHVTSLLANEQETWSAS